MECRLWQMNAMVLQVKGIPMLEGMGKKGDNLHNLGNSVVSGYCKAKDKMTCAQN